MLSFFPAIAHNPDRFYHPIGSGASSLARVFTRNVESLHFFFLVVFTKPVFFFSLLVCSGSGEAIQAGSQDFDPVISLSRLFHTTSLFSSVSLSAFALDS